MKRSPLAVVTGCAGFIGSHLSERLVADGWRVVGIDAFTDYYAREEKEENLLGLADEPGFELVEADLSHADVASVLARRAVVFHLAAQAGVRGSFGDGFAVYVRDNMLATQRVFEAALEARVRRVIWASSSSVYGDAAEYPSRESTTPTAPRSPYGVTKRACEDLAEVYRLRGLETVALRYFTVYGPRQRPDMAVRRICEAAVLATRFALFGDGSQSRDFTYVTDAVDATVRAASAPCPAPVLNVGGGEEATLARVISEVEALAGRRIRVERSTVQNGDVRRTGGDTTLARATLGWAPRATLTRGLQRQLAWVVARTAVPRHAVAA